ncbi:MAG: sigma-54 dependent transcriptional regulator [Gemmatimonadota bacterium]
MSESSARILVVDDDPTFRNVLEMRLQGWGYHVKVAANADTGSRIAEGWDPDLVLSDVVMPETSGIQLLERLRKDRPGRPVILLTAHGSLEMAVDAMKLGAVDFLTKPLNYRNLEAVLTEVLASPASLAPIADTVPAPDSDGKGAQGDPAGDTTSAEGPLPDEEGDLGPFLAVSRAMKDFFHLLRTAAESDAAVLITGESGTGKELAARTIHTLSARAEGPFVAVNAAAIPAELMESELFGHEKGSFTGATGEREGCFEMADGGTLFLDEIGEMPKALQPKLLRVLDGTPFRRVGGKKELSADVRIVAATNREPRAAVEEGALREDLFFRLNVLSLHLPALRDRDGDVAYLATSFADSLARKHGRPFRKFDDEALALLERYAWPGNVRELRNVVERAVVLSGEETIGTAQLPPYIREPDRATRGSYRFPADATAEETEKELILQTLDATENNKSETARRLGVSVRTIRNKLKTYGIDR